MIGIYLYYSYKISVLETISLCFKKNYKCYIAILEAIWLCSSDKCNTLVLCVARLANFANEFEFHWIPPTVHTTFCHI